MAMSRQQLLTVTGSTVMLAAAVTASALVLIVATDPMSVAALTTAGDAMSLLRAIAGRILALFW
jgi:hypothetical protein